MLPTSPPSFLRFAAHRIRPSARAVLSVLLNSIIALLLILPAIMGGYCLTSSARAATAPDQAFAEANGLFKEQKFAEAIEAYEAILKQNGFSANVLYNLGNACLKDKQYGRAILNFERAARLHPSDPEIHKNIAIARQEAGLPPIKVPWWLALLKHHSWDTWAYAASTSFALMWVAAGISLWRPDASRIVGVSKEGEVRFWRGSIGLLVLATFLLVAMLAVSLQPRLDGIVVKAGPALISPLEDAGEVFQLREGEIVNMERRSEGFFYVRKAKGEGGWVPGTRVQPIVQDLIQ